MDAALCTDGVRQAKGEEHMSIDEIMKVAETLSRGWWVDDETWPFPTELPKPMPSKPLPFNPDNHEESPW